jgi:2-hydroxy-6-oxonona-2,4-dienedioate hydrolase
MSRIVTLIIVATLAIALFAVMVLPWLLPRPGLDGSIPEHPFSDSAFVEIGNTRLHYRARLDSPTESELVVLIHGFGGSSFSWRHSLDFLEAQGFRAIAVDLPPFGYSERRADGPDWAELVLALADTIDSNAELILIGHSMGARVAARAAAESDERVAHLIMVAGTPGVSGRSQPGPGWMTRVPSLLRWAEILAAHRLIEQENFEAMLASALGRPPTPEELTGYREPLTIPGTYPALLRRLGLEAEKSGQGWEAVNTSLIWGDQDRWVSLERANELVNQHPELPLHVMPETGHNPMDTHPEEFHRILMQVLSGD